MDMNDLLMENVERQFKNIEEAVNHNRPVTSSTSNSLLIELCKIKQRVNAIEQMALQLYNQGPISNCDITDELVIAAVNNASHQIQNSEIDYKVKYPVHLDTATTLESDIHAIRESIDSLKSMLTVLEEQNDSNSLASIFSYAEQVISILNPGFLQRMELDYAVSFWYLL